MTHYYIQAPGDATLALDEIARIADKESGALIAVDGIDTSDITAGKAQLPLKTADEKRDYLFYIEAENRATAEDRAIVILDTALTGRDKPVYNNFLQFLRAYPQAPWRDQIQAILLHDEDEDAIDLLIFVPGSANVLAKYYYRGRAAYCCLDLIEHFTNIPVKR